MNAFLSVDVLWFFIFFLFFNSYKNCYANTDYNSEVWYNYYDIPVSALAIKVFLTRKYEAENGIKYIPYRQLQFGFVNKILVIICFILDAILYFGFNKHGYGPILLLLIYLFIQEYIPYTLVKKDVLRISSFSFIVHEGQPDFVQSKKEFPRWLKPTTLLDAFYWLGESTIWCNEGKYFLAYLLPNNQKIIIRLKTFDPRLFTNYGETKNRHNPAQYVFIEDIVNI